MNKFDKELRDLLYDAEMPVSSTLWDSIEKRIETRPDKPKYWMVFMLTALTLPIFLVINSDNKQKKVEIAEASSYNNQVEYQTFKTFNNQNKTESIQAITIGNSENPLLNVSNPINLVSSQNEVDGAVSVDLQKNTFTSIGSNRKTIFTSNETESNPINSVLLKFGTIAQPQSIERITNQVVESEYGDDRPLIQRLFSAGTKCPSFKRSLKGLYLWSDFTSSYASQSLGSMQGGFSQYVNLRNESEHSLFSYSFGAGVGFIHSSGLFIETGLTYDKINMRFYDKEENVIGSEEIIQILRDENGNEVGTQTEIRPIIGYNEIVNNNTFTQVEVPLLVGFEMPVTPGFSLAVKAGPNFNLSSANQGRIMNIEGSPFYYGSDSNNSIYKDKLGVGYIAGVNIVKNISTNTSFNIGLSVKSYGEFGNEENPLQQSFTKYGLSTGIRYRFL